MNGPEGWITKAELDAHLATLGADVSNRQLERWRNAGLLPQVSQETLPGDGSEVWFPPDTPARAATIAQLLRIKDSLDFAGWELWWRGFEVSEKYWRTPLEDTANRLDQVFAFVRKLVARDAKDETRPMFYERAGWGRPNLITSRPKRRAKPYDLQFLMRIASEVIANEFDGFEPATGDDDRPDDEAGIVRMFDLEGSETDQVHGLKVQLIGPLPEALRSLGRGYAARSLSDIARLPEGDLARARDRLRDGLRAVAAMHDATQWIFGPAPFGVRYVAWLARKAPLDLKRAYILGLALLETANFEMLSPDETAVMAAGAERWLSDSLALKKLWLTDARFRTVLSPRSIRTALMAPQEQKLLLNRIKGAKLKPS